MTEFQSYLQKFLALPQIILIAIVLVLIINLLLIVLELTRQAKVESAKHSYNPWFFNGAEILQYLVKYTDLKLNLEKVEYEYQSEIDNSSNTIYLSALTIYENTKFIAAEIFQLIASQYGGAIKAIFQFRKSLTILLTLSAYILIIWGLVQLDQTPLLIGSGIIILLFLVLIIAYMVLDIPRLRLVNNLISELKFLVDEDISVEEKSLRSISFWLSLESILEILNAPARLLNFFNPFTLVENLREKGTSA